MTGEMLIVQFRSFFSVIMITVCSTSIIIIPAEATSGGFSVNIGSEEYIATGIYLCIRGIEGSRESLNNIPIIPVTREHLQNKMNEADRFSRNALLNELQTPATLAQLRNKLISEERLMRAGLEICAPPSGWTKDDLRRIAEPKVVDHLAESLGVSDGSSRASTRALGDIIVQGVRTQSNIPGRS
ncbi:uncharacterized protein LOC111056676 isoform X2 [Nilaparvata lugens]|uniref:uncharacterized protein LOC111056676 isoform X2 n=1 Tax=Nilaparvata lugens TaxID=108931 RepID=UPI000B99B18C|nr:uncharacterized protein LOC111056676 isoform X2 [Nilaparvata lugens]